MTSIVTPGISRRPHFRSRVARVLSDAKFKAFVAANVIAVLVILVRMLGWLQPFELTIYDALRVLWAGEQQSGKILLVGVTDDDQNRWHDTLHDGDLAELLTRLSGWHPRAIGVDIFRGRSVGFGTEQLDAVLAQHHEIVWGFSHGSDVPAPKPLVNTERAAFTDFVTDPGNVVRRGLLFGAGQTALGVALAERYLRPNRIDFKIEPDAAENRAQEGGQQGSSPQPSSEEKTPDLLRLGQSIIRRLDRSRGPYVRLDDRGFQILLDYRGGRDPFHWVSMTQVMDDDLSPSVRDRVVIIGNVSRTVSDRFSTPFDSPLSWWTNVPQTRGMVIHAHLADQLISAALDGESSLNAFSHYTEMIWIWGWAIAGALVRIAVRRTIPALVAFLAGLMAIAVIVYGAFGMNLLLPAVPGWFAWLGSAGLGNWAIRAERLRRNRYGRGWAPPPADMPEGAIFISYAREDLAAVRTLKSSLDAAGLTVWFDFDQISAGDSFDLKIRNNIKRCSLFLPVLSRNTEARSEGFFRREWNYALDRALGIAPEVPFIIPVAVDDTNHFNIPPRFEEADIATLPEGQVTQKFVERLKSAVGQHAPTSLHLEGTASSVG
jgi:CHASE2 domain-containing sensor protein